MIKYILCLTLITSLAHADQDCSKVSPVKPTDVITCDGFFFPPSAEEEASLAKLNAAIFKKAFNESQAKSDALEEHSQILERRLNLYMQQADTLSQREAKRDNTESLYRTLYFGLGALLTGFIAANVSK